MKRRFTFIAVFIFAITCACVGADSNKAHPYPQRTIVCDNLYQGNSIEEAIAFTGAPDDMRDKNIRCLSRHGKLAEGKSLAFANRLFNIGRTRNVDDFKTLLSRQMNGLLADNNKRTMLSVQIEQIKGGQAFGADCEDDFYGQCDAKYVVIFGEIDKNILENSEWYYFPEKPTHQLGFFHFHKPHYSMTGTMNYVVEENGDYKIVAASCKNQDAPEYQKPERIGPVTFSGVSRKTMFDISDKSFDEWHIALTAEDNKNHCIEVVRTSLVIKGDKKLKDNEMRDVVIDYSNFEKYADFWNDFRFIFRADFKSASSKFFGPGRSGLDYNFSIAATFKGSTLMYPGQDISNINLKEDGVFEDGELELFSFNSTAEDGTVYRNRIYVCLTAKNSL